MPYSDLDDLRFKLRLVSMSLRSSFKCTAAVSCGTKALYGRDGSSLRFRLILDRSCVNHEAASNMPSTFHALFTSDSEFGLPMRSREKLCGKVSNLFEYWNRFPGLCTLAHFKKKLWIIQKCSLIE